MTVIVPLERVPGMTRRMLFAAPRLLGKWSTDQVARLKQAYNVGGHQKHGGRRWQPEKPPTLPMLVKSGRMRRSTKANRVIGLKTTPKVTLTNTASYARFHHLGTKNLPKRPLIIVTRNDEAALRKKMKIGLERSLL